MGMPQIEEGQSVYSCKQCNTILATKVCLFSTAYRGTTGDAYLFESVLNVDYKEKQEKIFITGKHLIGDVVCKGCGQTIGWKYYFVSEKDQQHKVNKVLLEISYLVESII